MPVTPGLRVRYSNLCAFIAQFKEAVMVRLSSSLGALTCAALLAVTASPALAQEPAPPPPTTAPPTAAPEAGEVSGKPLYEGFHLGVGSSFGGDSTAILATGFLDSFLFAVGVQLKYD